MKNLVLLLFLTMPLHAQTIARMLAGVNPQNGTTYTFQQRDSIFLTTFSNAAPIAVTLPNGLTDGFGAGQLFSVVNLGVGTATVTCSGCTINGSGTLALTTGASADIYSDGLNYSAQTGGSSGGSGTVTSIATTAPITGGTITTTGTIACATCTTSAAALTANGVVVGAGGQAEAVSTVLTENGTTATYTGTGGILSTTSGGLKAGANGGAAGVLTLFGSTSGSSTLTASVNGATATFSGALAAGVGGVTTTTNNSTGLTVLSNTGGAGATLGHIQESITLNTGGTTTDSAGNLLPAGSLILAVTARITTTITTAANWSLGDATTAARFAAANSTLTAGTTSIGMQQMQGSVATDAAGPVQTAAAKLRITTNVNPGAGVIHIDVFYIQFAAPTS